MLKKYKNQFVEFINNFDVGTNDYSILEIEGTEDNPGGDLELKINDTEFFFRIKSYAGDWNLFWIEFRAFEPTYPVKTLPKSAEYFDFDWCLRWLEIWTNKHLKEYYDELKRPDLLEAFKEGQKNNIEEIDFDKNEPFSNSERQLLKQGLTEIKSLIKEEFDFTKGQLNLIENRINYLEEATDRLNKTDWKGILISTIFSIITSLALDPTNSRKIIRLFSKIMENIPQFNW